MFLPRQLAVKRPNSTPQTTPRQPGEQTLADDNIPVKRRRVELENPGSINSHDAIEIVKCLELLFSDYFTQNVSPGWLIKKTRTIDGHHDCMWCIYLTPWHTNVFRCSPICSIGTRDFLNDKTTPHPKETGYSLAVLSVAET